MADSNVSTRYGIIRKRHVRDARGGRKRGGINHGLPYDAKVAELKNKNRADPVCHCDEIRPNRLVWILHDRKTPAIRAKTADIVTKQRKTDPGPDAILAQSEGSETVDPLQAFALAFEKLTCVKDVTFL